MVDFSHQAYYHCFLCENFDPFKEMVETKSALISDVSR